MLKNLNFVGNSEEFDEIPPTASDKGPYTIGGPRDLDHISCIATSHHCFLATLEEILQ